MINNEKTSRDTATVIDGHARAAMRLGLVSMLKSFNAEDLYQKDKTVVRSSYIFIMGSPTLIRQHLYLAPELATQSKLSQATGEHGARLDLSPNCDVREF